MPLQPLYQSASSLSSDRRRIDMAGFVNRLVNFRPTLRLSGQCWAVSAHCVNKSSRQFFGTPHATVVQPYRRAFDRPSQFVFKTMPGSNSPVADRRSPRQHCFAPITSMNQHSMTSDEISEPSLDRSNHETLLSRRLPGSPFAIVTLAYPVLLSLGMIGIAAAIWWIG